MGDQPNVQSNQDMIVLEEAQLLALLVLKLVEMDLDSILYQLTVMITIQFQEMDAMLLVV